MKKRYFKKQSNQRKVLGCRRIFPLSSEKKFHSAPPFTCQQSLELSMIERHQTPKSAQREQVNNLIIIHKKTDFQTDKKVNNQKFQTDLCSVGVEVLASFWVILALIVPESGKKVFSSPLKKSWYRQNPLINLCVIQKTDAVRFQRRSHLYAVIWNKYQKDN